jgi:hypothetical protein
VRKIKKPMAGRRETFVAPEDRAKIRDCYPPGAPFRAFLEFCWETGCRPQEARYIEPRHVHLDRAVIAIPPAEAKGRKAWRVIRLDGRARALVRERLTTAAGKVFTNRDGAAWSSYALNCRFARLKEKLGGKFCAYEFRHGFTQRLLVRGVDHLTVAALLGHADGQMVQKVYSHMDQADDHLRGRPAAGVRPVTGGCRLKRVASRTPGGLARLRPHIERRHQRVQVERVDEDLPPPAFDPDPQVRQHPIRHPRADEVWADTRRRGGGVDREERRRGW